MKKENLLIVGACALLVFFNFWNLDFPTSYHGDETKKVAFIMKNIQDFKHPILMLHLGRLFSSLLGLENASTVAIAARCVSAISCIGMALAMYYFSKEKMGKLRSLALAIAVGLVPIMVIHGHYIKEDMLFSLMLLISLFSAGRFFENASIKNMVLMGAALGFTISSKYVGAFLIPVLLLFPLVARLKNLKSLYKMIALSLPVALGVFLLVNFPLLMQKSTFYKSFAFEVKHSLVGHEHKGPGSTYICPAPIRASDYFFSFHLIHSLIPGMGMLLFIMSFLGVGVSLAKFKDISIQEKLFLVVIGVYYLMVEVSPLKVFPDVTRYVIPIIPLCIYFAFKLLDHLPRQMLLQYGARLALGTGVIFAGWDSFQLISNIKSDTREKVSVWMKEHPKASVRGDQYATGVKGACCVSTLDLKKIKDEGVEYLISSNFFYDRVMIMSKFKNCHPQIAKARMQLDLLFSQPYEEIKPKHRSFGFSNPVIRVIDIRQLDLSQLTVASESFADKEE